MNGENSGRTKLLYVYNEGLGSANKRVDMLAKAAKDARIRAEAIALQAGSEVGGLKKVNTGVFQITVPNSTRVSSWGSYDTSTIKKDITAVMGVTFAVK